MGIFKVENHILEIDKDYVRGIPEFRIILERDKGSKGDVDGRKKYYAYKEFYYIYIVADLKSFPNKGGLNEKEVHKAAIKESELEETYKPDKDIKAAITKYRYIQDIENPTLKTLTTVLRGLTTADTISQNIIDNINRAIELQEKVRSEKENNQEPKNAADEAVATANLVGQLKQLLGIANDLPKTIATLETLEIKLAKDEANIKLGRGGKEIGNRADPNRKRN